VGKSATGYELFAQLAKRRDRVAFIEIDQIGMCMPAPAEARSAAKADNLLGVLDMSAGAGMLLLVPGGLFELVFLPIWLITKGFKPLPSTADLSSLALVTAH